MRALNDREIDSVSGGSLLLWGGLLGANLLGGLLNAVTSGGANAASNSGSTLASTTAVTPGGTHGFVPSTRQPGDIFDGLVQRGAGIVEAAIQDIAGHVSAGIRDVADLFGRLL